MTQALTLPSFKNLSFGAFAIGLAFCCFFMQAPRAHAASLTEPQIEAVVGLLASFDVEESAIANVEDILRQSDATDPISVSMAAESSVTLSASPVVSEAAAPQPDVAIAPTCPPLHAGVTAISAQNGQGSCSVSTTTGTAAPNDQEVLTAALPLSPASSGVPDIAGLMVAAAIAPWQAAVDSFSQILYGIGAY